MMGWRGWRAAGLAALFAALGCADGESPEDGRYDLRTLFGEPVPYVDTLGCCIYTGGHLRLESAEYDLRLYFQNKNNQLVDTAFETGEYTLHGGALGFTPRSANFPLSLFGATLSHDTIRLSLGGDGPGAADQFPAVFVR